MNEQLPHETHPDHQTSHGNHGWMMIACCIPMLAIAGILVATGVLSAGFLLLAVGCTAMMALMMGGMGHGRENDPEETTTDGGTSPPRSR